MKQKFDPQTAPVVPEAALEVMADVDDTEVVRASDVANFLKVGEVSGDVDRRDIMIPQLAIAQNVGPLSADFKGGDIVINKEVVVAAVGQTVNTTVMSIAKTYEERLPYDANGPRPKQFKTIVEVRAAGLTVDYAQGSRVPPGAREVATILLLVEKPTDLVSSAFPFKHKDKAYAVARWIVRSTAYSRAAKQILSRAAIELHDTGLVSGAWTLKTEREQINGNWVFVPVLRLQGTLHDAEFIAFVETFKR